MQRYNGPQENDRERNGRRDFSRRGQRRDFDERPRDERGRFADDDERRFDDDRDDDRDWLLRDQDRFGPRDFGREAPDFGQQRGRYGEERRYYEERGGRGFGEGRRERGHFGGRSDLPNWERQRLGEFGPREWSEWQPQPAAGRGLGSDRGRHFGKGPKGYQRSEQRVLEDVNDALERHPEIDASEIEVQCENGVIVLRGTVESRHAKRMAEECVEDISGVKDVRNELRTQSQQSQQTQLGGGSQSGQRATGFESSQRESEKQQRKM